MTAVTTWDRSDIRAAPSLVVDVVVTAAAVLAIFNAGHPLATWVILGYLLTWPGDLLRRAFGIPVRALAERLVYAVGSSLVMLLVLTIVVEGMSLLIGVGRPFAHAPLAWGTVALSVVMALVGHRDGAAEAGPWLPEARVWVLVVGLISPLVVVAGAKWVDNGRGPGLTLAAFGAVVAASAVALVRARRGGERADADLTVLAFSLALGIAWSYSMRTPYLFGYDLHQELATVTQTLTSQVWRPEQGNAYNASLSLSSVPTGLVVLTGMAPTLLLKSVYPLLLAVLPTAMFLVLRRFTSSVVAFTLTIFVGLNPLGYWQVAVISRQEMAFGIFAALLFLLVCGQGSVRSRQALAFVLGLGIVLAHYSTSYVAITVLGLGVVLGWVARRWMGVLDRSTRAVPWGLPVAMLVAAFLWGHVLNQSTENVDRTAQSATAQVGLRNSGSWLDSFLKGGLSSSAATPAEVFDAAKPVAAQRPWLRPYSAQVQREFPALPATTPNAAALPQLAGPFDAGFTLLRLLVNLGAALSGVLLAFLVVRRRRLGADALPLVGLVGGALVLSLVVRFNVGLASAYNAERLVVQLAPLVALALVMAWRQLPEAVRTRRVVRSSATVFVMIALVGGLVDSIGLRGLVTGSTAGNLRAGDEYALRYGETEYDHAAANWLEQRFAPTNQVYADRYGALLLHDDPSMRNGVFDTMVPALLDQRAFIFATTENWHRGRARAQIGGQLATYKFPRSFMQKYKTLAYDNGSARVYD